MKKIPYGRQSIDRSDIGDVSRVLRTDWITQGPKVSEFEEALASYCGAKYAVAVSSGTAALHIACLAAGLKAGDEAVTTPVTFVATANSVLYAGAKPVFADIDRNTVNIDAGKIKEKITGRTKAILPVHFAGLVCDMEGIGREAKKNKLVVIEDACHALGAEYRTQSAGRKAQSVWKRAGCCEHSDMTVFSFHPVKSITTGEGGAVTTNSEILYRKLLALRSHGAYKDERTASVGGWYYEMRDLGFNYRMTDMQCALGLSQLKKLNDFLERRREIASTYNGEFGGLGDIVTLPGGDSPERKHAWHLYLLRIDPEKVSLTKREVYDLLQGKGIGVQVHYLPVYRHPYYRENGYKDVFCPVAEKYYEEAVSLPIFPSLSAKELKYVIKTVKNLIQRSCKNTM